MGPRSSRNGRPPVISLKFGPQGTRALATFTRKHEREPMAIVLDGQLLFGPLPAAAAPP